MAGLSNSRWASSPHLSLPSTKLPKSSLDPSSHISHCSSPYPSSPSRSHSPHKDSVAIKPAASDTSKAPLSRTAKENLERFLRIVARLRWKHPGLRGAYYMALAAQDHRWKCKNNQPKDPKDPKDPHDKEMDEAVDEGNVGEPDACSMFKLDFFEYYMLLEGAVIHLLAIFSQHVTKSKSAAALAGSRYAGGSAGHSWHWDVLRALESSSVLGPLLNERVAEGEFTTGRSAFYMAKTLRNRWKHADVEMMTGDEMSAGAGFRDWDQDMEIGSFDFEGMLGVIFGFFERAYAAVLERNREERRRRRMAEEGGGEWPMEMEVDEDLEKVGKGKGSGDIRDWGFLDSAMDWEEI